MDPEELSRAMLSDCDENDQWEECFKAVEDWEEQQDLIAKSNLVNDEEAPRQEHLEVLARCFGHKKFRPMQWKIISSIINDKRDNCAIMATGYGKSLCFQYPAVYIGGITIVVSPLISLMEDQILSLEMSNISACLLGSAQTQKQLTIDDIFAGKYSLVYITPEFACGDYGEGLLKRMNNSLPIILLAIDEAHCVSSWGHDFRFQYRQLGQLRTVLPHVPILAVTATATPKVRSDIVTTLKLRNAQVLCSGFDRPNLQFAVYLKGNAGILSDLKKVMVQKNGVYGFSGSTIIYCITRKQTEEVAQLLKLNGIRCLPYHAGMTVKGRKETHEKFVRDKVQIIVATIAFGMGIDKPDVRYVIHCGSSKDIESYYQEVGRAGRDGQPSFCITFYSSGDFDLHDTIQELNGMSDRNRTRRQAMQKIMVQYLETRDCRRQFILNHFEGSVSPKKPRPKCCDCCTRKLHQSVSDSNRYEGLNEQGLYDFTKDAEVFLDAVKTMGGKFGLGMYILYVRGSRSSKLQGSLMQNRSYGSGKYQTEDWWKAVGRLLEREGYLNKVFNKRFGNNKGKNMYNTFQVSSKGEQILNNIRMYPNTTKILLPPPPEIFKLLKYKISPEPSAESDFINIAPSCSKKLLTSKPSLKLLKLSSQSSSKLTQGVDSDNSEIETESNGATTEKQECMTIYRLLMNKRAEIASTNDCMPYMVASNEALMKMAQKKPLSIKELRECQLDGFTEAKVSRFGDEFVKTLRIICNVTSSPTESVKKTIQDILAEYPLPGARLNTTAEATYSMYKSGLTAKEIATKRGVIMSTIFSHLSDAIKVGYPIKMIDLGITYELREEIFKVIKNHPPESSITVLKEFCPPEVTFDILHVVMAYMDVRKHLSNLKLAYEEYEDFQYESDITGLQNKRKESETSVTSPAENLTKKIKLEPVPLSKYSSENNAKEMLSSTSKVQVKSDSVLTLQKRTDRILELLDSPLEKRKVKTKKTLDLDETLLDDEFFDDNTLSNMDRIITLEKNKGRSLTEDIKPKINEIPCINNVPTQKSPSINDAPAQNIPVTNDIPTQSTSAACSSLTSVADNTEKGKIKKFQFKSKVPLSVEKSTQKLYNLQQWIQKPT